MSALPALRRMRWHSLRNRLREVRQQPRLKTAFIALFAIGLFVGLWVLFLRGFQFLDAFEGANVIILNRLFSLFFFGMGAMVAVSGIVTSYATQYRSEEIPFLLCRPIPPGEIVHYKFMESVTLSSWAFFFIIIPFIGAFAWHQNLSPAIGGWTLLFCVPYVLLCAALGSLVTQITVRWFPSRRIVPVFFTLAACALAGGLWIFLREASAAVEPSSLFLHRLIPGLRIAGHPLLPSRWLADGVLSLSRGDTLRGVLLLTALTTNALMLAWLVRWLGSWTFEKAWMRVSAAPASTRRRTGAFRRIDRLLSPLPQDVRALVGKDIRVFFRDPMQWSQALVFFGLLGLYFANLRSFHYHLLEPQWKITIAFLNVFSVSAVLCSLGSRFVYPQLSLEGHQFWILGLAPTSMGRVLFSKFALALVAMLATGATLVLLSASMLDLDPAPRRVALAISAAVACAIAGLSTGLGAVFLDPRERNPAAIVSGFGGTLNLVLCLCFLLLAILPFAALFQLDVTGRLPPHLLRRGLVLAGGALVALTAAATLIPLALGRRSLQRREF